MADSKIKELLGKGVKLVDSVEIQISLNKHYKYALEDLLNESLSILGQNKLLEILTNYKYIKGGEING